MKTKNYFNNIWLKLKRFAKLHTWPFGEDYSRFTLISSPADMNFRNINSVIKYTFEQLFILCILLYYLYKLFLQEHVFDQYGSCSRRSINRLLFGISWKSLQELINLVFFLTRGNDLMDCEEINFWKRTRNCYVGEVKSRLTNIV